MTISFIVTSYNYANFIQETIKSIKNQTCKDCEIIVVDDFSTDNSVEILQKIDGIKLICHDQNKGQLASIITGLKYATGDYISIIDSDDTIYPEFAQTLVEEIKNNDIALVCCNSKETKLLTPKNASFGGWWWTPMSCGMLKKEYITDLLNYKNTKYWKICPDKLIFNLAHLQGNSKIINKILVNKREHDKNAGKTNFRFFVNLKNNFIIRKEALKILSNKEYRGIIYKSYFHIFTQIINFCNKK